MFVLRVSWISTSFAVLFMAGLFHGGLSHANPCADLFAFNYRAQKLEQLKSYGEELGTLVKAGLLSEGQLMSGQVISGRHIITGIEFVFVLTAENQIYYARRGLSPVLVYGSEPIPGAGAILQLAAFKEIALADGNYILFIPTPRGISVELSAYSLRQLAAARSETRDENGIQPKREESPREVIDRVTRAVVEAQSAFQSENARSELGVKYRVALESLVENQFISGKSLAEGTLYEIRAERGFAFNPGAERALVIEYESTLHLVQLKSDGTVMYNRIEAEAFEQGTTYYVDRAMVTPGSYEVITEGSARFGERLTILERITPEEIEKATPPFLRARRSR